MTDQFLLDDNISFARNHPGDGDGVHDNLLRHKNCRFQVSTVGIGNDIPCNVMGTIG